MAGITSYPTTQAAGVAGQVADQTLRASRAVLNKEAAAIPFGVAVKKGAADREALLPSLAGDKVEGIAVFTHATNQVGVTGGDIASGDAFDILERGRIFVKVEEAVVENDPVHVRYAGAGQKGGFRKSAVLNETFGPVKGARFLSSAGAGGIAILEFDALVALTT